MEANVNKRVRRVKPYKIIIFFLLLVSALLFFFPFYWTFISSIKTKEEIWFFPPAFFPREIMWSNYYEALQSNIGLFVFNSTFRAN